jgi:hypothetical protein
MRPDQPVSNMQGMGALDFINPMNWLFNNDDWYGKLGRLGEGLATAGTQAIGNVGEILRSAPQVANNMTQAATMASDAVNQAVAPLQPKPAPMTTQQVPNPFARDDDAVNQ